MIFRRIQKSTGIKFLKEGIKAVYRNHDLEG
jgi:hypothetical protein